MGCQDWQEDDSLSKLFHRKFNAKWVWWREIPWTVAEHGDASSVYLTRKFSDKHPGHFSEYNVVLSLTEASIKLCPHSSRLRGGKTIPKKISNRDLNRDFFK